MTPTSTALIAIAVIVLLYLAGAIRILREYQRAVVFTRGRFAGVKGPGVILVFSFIQTMVRVDRSCPVIRYLERARAVGRALQPRRDGHVDVAGRDRRHLHGSARLCLGSLQPLDLFKGRSTATANDAPPLVATSAATARSAPGKPADGADTKAPTAVRF